MSHSCSDGATACLNAGGKQMVDSSSGEVSLTGQPRLELPTISSPAQGPVDKTMGPMQSESTLIHSSAG